MSRATFNSFLVFLLFGSIYVTAQSNEPSDVATQDAIRSHLAMIAGLFKKGDFAIPMFIHSTTPPGVQIIQRLKDKITYDAENTERGGQLRITTHDPEACDDAERFAAGRCGYAPTRHSF